MARATALGLKVPREDFFTIGCCGFRLRIEDPQVEREIVALLEAHQAQNRLGDA